VIVGVAEGGGGVRVAGSDVEVAVAVELGCGDGGCDGVESGVGFAMPSDPRLQDAIVARPKSVAARKTM
jgi:hypothetical protein